MRYPSIDSKFFIENRKKFSVQLEPKSLAIFSSNDEMPESGDSLFLFHQNADLFYLTGIDQEETMLILFPDCPRKEYQEVLLLRRTSDLIAVWEGHKYSIEEAQKATGIKTVMWADELDSILHLLMALCDHVYLDLNENDRRKITTEERSERFARELIHQYPIHDYRRSAKIMMGLREIKAETEVALIKEACRITGLAFERVMKFVKPGVTEFEIEAEITHEFIRNRSKGNAYPPIIAAGKNSCVLHYNQNSEECRDGDVLLLDFGAEYAHYAADLTRTIPVNGKFSPRQKDVYNAVLRVQRKAISMLKPGLILEEYNKEVGKATEEELVKLGLLKSDDVKKQDPDKPLYKKYFMHGTSHHLGLDVHDFGNKYEPLKAGMVLTCEPGIYIPEEKIGVRIENDILLTQANPIDLMEMIPVEADEIEARMKK